MASPTILRVPIHIEARLKSECLVPRVEVKARIASYLSAHVPVFRPGPLEGYAAADALLGQTLASLVVEVGGGEEEQAVSYWRSDVNAHVFKFVEEDQQPLGGLDFALDESNNEGGAPTAFSALVCPCQELEGQWESIFVQPATKDVLLAMAAASMYFSMYGVNPTLVSGSRLILLHGEPGTGKSTLARGLAQKVRWLCVHCVGACYFMGSLASLVHTIYPPPHLFIQFYPAPRDSWPSATATPSRAAWSSSASTPTRSYPSTWASRARASRACSATSASGSRTSPPPSSSA